MKNTIKWIAAVLILLVSALAIYIFIITPHYKAYKAINDYKDGNIFYYNMGWRWPDMEISDAMAEDLCIACDEYPIQMATRQKYNQLIFQLKPKQIYSYEYLKNTSSDINLYEYTSLKYDDYKIFKSAWKTWEKFENFNIQMNSNKPGYKYIKEDSVIIYKKLNVSERRYYFKTLASNGIYETQLVFIFDKGWKLSAVFNKKID